MEDKRCTSVAMLELMIAKRAKIVNASRKDPISLLSAMKLNIKIIPWECPC